MDKSFNIIVCLNKGNVIGNNNDLLYHIPNDLANFKRLTANNVVIMGRTTLESLPGGKPLSNRINIVLTKDMSYHMDNIIVAHSIDEVMEICQKHYSDKEKFVIGGGNVYKQFIDKKMVNKLYLTEVDDNTDGDTKFPMVNRNEYKTIFQTEWYPVKNQTYNYRYHILKLVY